MYSILDRSITKSLDIDIPRDIRTTIAHFSEVDIFYDYLYGNDKVEVQLDQDENIVIENDIKPNVDWTDYNFGRFYVRYRFKMRNKGDDDRLSIYFVNGLEENDVSSLWKRIQKDTKHYHC